MRLDTVNPVFRSGGLASSVAAITPAQKARIGREAPFAPAELQRRLARVRAETGRRGLAAILVVDPAGVFYLTGIDSASVSHLQCLIVPADGEESFFTWDFELGNATLPGTVTTVATYNWYEDPLSGLAVRLRDAGLDKERVGVDIRSRYFSAALLSGLRTALPKVHFEDSFGIVEECRLRKSPAELAYMRAAAELTDNSVAVGFDAAKVGARDSDVAAAIMGYLYAAGSEALSGGLIVATGYNAGIGHASFTGRRLEQGDTVFLEYSAQIHHYVAPVMRTAVLGKPTTEQAEFRDAGMAAIDAVLANARPGVTASAVARAALDCLRPVRAKIYFHGLVAYSVGLGFPPSRYEHLGYELREGNDRPLEEGMAFHVVMSLRKFAEFGVSQSHTVVITKSGCEAITRSPAALAQL